MSVNAYGRVVRAKARQSRGLALVELFVGLAVLAMALSIGLLAYEQAVSSARIQGRRDAARELVELSLERARAFELSALPAPGAALDLGVPGEFRPRLKGASCKLTVSDGPAPALKRIHVEVACAGLSLPQSGEALIRYAAAQKEGKP